MGAHGRESTLDRCNVESKDLRKVIAVHEDSAL
jgi:hypothetical protein